MKNRDGGLGGYVIDMCIPILDDFFSQGKKKEESRWITEASMKGKTAIIIR